MLNEIKCSAAQIKGQICFQKCFIEGNIILRRSQIGELYLTDVILKEVDLSSCQIGNLFLAQIPNNVQPEATPIISSWMLNSKLLLRGTRVDRIYDNRDSWPPKVDLEDLEYHYIGPHNDSGISSLPDRECYIAWLSNHQPYSPQPYEQCARVLREAGQTDKANAVLYAGKNRERRELTWRGSIARKSWLTLMWLTMGYGLGWRYICSLIWAALLVAIGVWVLEGQEVGYLLADTERVTTIILSVTERWSYSFGNFVPILAIEEWHKKIELFGLVMVCFAVLIILGYGLLSLIVARITGVTK
jgi:hypothetical protein